MRQLTYPSGAVHGFNWTQTVDFTSTVTTTAWVDVTSMSVALPAGVRFYFCYNVYTNHNSASTRSTRVSPFYTGTATNILYTKKMRVGNAVTESFVSGLTAWQNTLDQVVATNVGVCVQMQGMFTTTTAGNLNLQIAKNSATAYENYTYEGNTLQLLPLGTA